jgi:protein tyrosine phosphatase (PTP) superfamily phosphohydrolase (DUF442 family)
MSVAAEFGVRRRKSIAQGVSLAFGFLAAASVTVAVDTPAVANSDPPTAEQRDPRWAVRLERPGLGNFYQVSSTLYRGAQPTPQGLAELRRLGVKTVVSLRAFHGERAAVAQSGLSYERISFKVWHPEDEDMRRLLAIVTDPARQPVYVHCLRGADRTGTAIAIYRICVQGWTREDAIDEMKSGGFRFNPRFVQLERYLRSVDPTALSRNVDGSTRPRSDSNPASPP